MSSHEYFEFCRMKDGLVYQFDLIKSANENVEYKRRDLDIWMLFNQDFGWVVCESDKETIIGRSWDVPVIKQSNLPPAGTWVSCKHKESYVYKLEFRDSEL